MGLLDKLLRGMMGGHHGSRYGGQYGGKHGGGHGGYGPYSGGPPPATPQPSGIACPKCGTANLESARFCQQCGASLQPAQCASCGGALAAGAKFCGQCGKPRA